jgi:hypothetical protein
MGGCYSVTLGRTVVPSRLLFQKSTIVPGRRSTRFKLWCRATFMKNGAAGTKGAAVAHLVLADETEMAFDI